MTHHEIEKLCTKVTYNKSIATHLVEPLLHEFFRVRLKSKQQRRAYRDLQRAYDSREAYCRRILRRDIFKQKAAQDLVRDLAAEAREIVAAGDA